MSSVYIVGGRDGGIAFMFRERGWDVVDSIEHADLVQFTGGEDVWPRLYGEETHHTTYCNPRRDIVEMGYYQAAKLLGKPMAGICRGGQFLNVMNGGKLWQNVNGHALHGTHAAYLIHADGSVISEVQVTSTHHQMIRPTDDALVFVVANEASRKENEKESIAGDGNDCESCYYKASKSLCFQPHPEYLKHVDCTDLYFTLINSLFKL